MANLFRRRRPWCRFSTAAFYLLVNKALRSLDRMELNPEGTLLDIIHR
jgi:hypothetical protein